MWDIIAIRIVIHDGGRTMKTVQMTLDESLVTAVDRAAKQLGTTRSAFARTALRRALDELRTKELELQHRDGYRGKPVVEKEFSSWEGEQVWGEP
jgi:Arc/MetJ family transcription regulator